MTALKSLEQFNQEHGDYYMQARRETAKNGIACPNCGNELTDINPFILLVGIPPRMSVACDKCHYQGTRIA